MANREAASADGWYRLSLCTCPLVPGKIRGDDVVLTGRTDGRSEIFFALWWNRDGGSGNGTVH
ncbi:MAG TPA: hypothetical protein PLL36_12075 [Candidatus Hydrogenedentes bacterium]|nr:hypothetical protein [Candidatus Hydrogenedentota bacterium]